MAVGRNYELKARFSAEVDGSVNKAFAGMHSRLNNLEKKIQRVDKEDVNVTFDERGATELEARLDKLEKKLSSVDGKNVKPEVGMKDTEFYAKVKKVEVRVNALTAKTYEMKLGAKTSEARAELSALQRQVRAVTNRIYDLKVRGDIDGVTEGLAELEVLEHKIGDLDGEVINIRTKFDRNTFGMLGKALGDTAEGLTSVDRHIQGMSRWGQILQNFGQLGIAAFIGLAAAASGPLLSGLTILAGAIVAVGTGFGLMLLSAAPIIKAFAQQKANATALKSAQDSLSSSTDALKTAQKGLKDAVEGVSEARRSGTEQIRSAIQAETSAAQATEDAQRSYKDAHEASADAAQELDDATSSLNDALQTEQMRLATMRNDLAGMKLSQKELGFEIRSTERELAKGNLTLEERRDAEFRLKELELQRKQGVIDIKTAQRGLTKAEKEGTDELKTAISAREDAKKGVDDAKQSEKEAGRAVVAAMKAQKQAAKDTANARKDAARTVDDALEAVTEAEKAVSDAAKKVKSDQQAVNAVLARTPKYMQPLLTAVETFKNKYHNSFADAHQQTVKFGVELVHAANKTLPMLGTAAFKTTRRVQNAFHQLGREGIKFGALESFQRIIKSVPGITAQWTKAFGRFGAGFTNIMGQAVPYIRRFSKWVAEIALKFLKWTDSAKGRKQIHKFFESAAPLAHDLFKWAMRIGGAILHWSINHPKELAAVLDMIGTALFAAARFGMFLMNQLFRISKTEHRWRNLALAAVGFRIALSLIGLAARGAFVLIGRLISGVVGLFKKFAPAIARWVVRPVARAVMTIIRGFRLLPKQWGIIWRFLGSATVMGVEGLLVTFGRLTLVGAVFAFIVNVAKRAWNNLIKHTAPIVLGLYKMWKNGSINIAQFLFNIWRMTIAGVEEIIIGGFLDTIRGVLKLVRGLVNTIGGIFGHAKLGDALFGDLNGGPADKALKKFTNFVRGDTNKMAMDMIKNSKQGTGGTIKELIGLGKDSKKTMGNMESNTHQNMTDLKLAMVNQSKEGSNKGVSNFKEFNKKGSFNMEDLNKSGKLSMKDLFKGTDLNLGKMKSSGLGSTDDLKTGGIKDFWDFNKSGVKAADDLKVDASNSMGTMQSDVNSSTNITQHKGVADLEDLRKNGGSTLDSAKANWVGTMNETSGGMQGALNNVIKGVGSFIKSVDIDVEAPKQFSIVGATAGGSLGGNGGGGGGGGGGGARARGGIDKFASGGVQTPVGGVSNGTTRVYGEVPGTTEFYITDNKKYRDRNMDILAEANKHMMMAGGGKAIFHDEITGEYRKKRPGEIIEAVSVPRGQINLTHGDHRLGMHGPMANTALRASGMWKAPSVFEKGRDARVFRSAGGGSARTTSTGTISVDPGFHGPILKSILAHEEGHALGMGHSSSGIMQPTLHGAVHPSHREIRWVHQNYESKIHGGGGHGHHSGHHGGHGGHDGGGHGGSGGDKSDSKKEDKLSKKEQRKQDAKERRKAARAARKFRHNFNKNKKNYGPLGEPPDYSRNAAWMARGGSLQIPATHKMANDTLARLAKTPHHERDDVDRSRPGEITEYYDATGATTHNWDGPTQNKVNELYKEFGHGKLSMNTYKGHGNAPGGGHAERSTVDHWGPGGRGDNIAKSVGDDVVGYVTGHWKDQIYYYIWQGLIHGWGHVKKYSPMGPGDSTHYDHAHVTYMPNGGKGGGDIGSGSGDSGPSLEEVQKIYDKKVPHIVVPEHHLGFRGPGMSADNVAMALRTKLTEKAASSGSSTSSKKGSAEGMEILAAAKAAGWEGSDAERISAIAYRESGLYEDASPQHPPPGGYYHDSNYRSGDPSIGLIQMIGSYAKQKWGMSSLEEAQKKLMLGLDNLALAKQLHKEAGWGPWTTAPSRNEKGHIHDKVKRSSHAKGGIIGYSHGGIAAKPHFGLIGDRGPEVNLPLDDPRAVNMMRRAFDMSSKVTSSGMQRANQKARQKGAWAGSDELQGSGVINDMWTNASGDDYGERLESAIREQTEDIVQAVLSDLNLSDASAEKYARMGMKLMKEMMENPHIGGDINEAHMVQRMDFRRELTRK